MSSPSFPAPTVPVAMFYWNGSSWDRFSGGAEIPPSFMVALLLDTASAELRGMARHNFSSNALAAGGNATVYTPTVGNRFYCLGFCVSVSAATNISLRRSTTKFVSLQFPQAGTYWLNYPPPGLKGGVSELFAVYNDGSATVTVDVEIWGHETTVNLGST